MCLSASLDSPICPLLLSQPVLARRFCYIEMAASHHVLQTERTDSQCPAEQQTSATMCIVVRHRILKTHMQTQECLLGKAVRSLQRQGGTCPTALAGAAACLGPPLHSRNSGAVPPAQVHCSCFVYVYKYADRPKCPESNNHTFNAADSTYICISVASRVSSLLSWRVLGHMLLLLCSG